MTQQATAVRDSGRFSGEAHAVLQMARLADVGTSGPVVIVEANGIRVRDSRGKEYIDALAGLLNVNVGYGREELVEAAAQAMRRLSFGTSFFGRTTREVLDLAEKLASITPPGINRIFFSVGGSDAIDTAIKLLRHRNVLAGQPEKMTVIARRDSYHGMTFGATTATGQKILRERIGPLLPHVLHVEQPEGGEVSAEKLERVIIEQGPETIAAFLGEPVALPPGLAVPPDDYWPAMRDVCTRYDVKLIADEVITGFGRTGRMFACENWDLEPDLMTMSKGLTSGYQCLGAVGIREDHYQELFASETMLPHGFTAGGHPVACAVALANIEIIEREGLVQNAAEVGGYLGDQVRELADRHDSVIAVRSIGMMAAFDVDGELLSADGDPASEAGLRLAKLLMELGVIVRQYGNTIAMAPPLIATRADIDEIVGRFDTALTQMAR
jgi:4-aminobutyrate--pyruvate transaminase